jgi:hypothetical protein
MLELLRKDLNRQLKNLLFLLYMLDFATLFVENELNFGDIVFRFCPSLLAFYFVFSHKHDYLFFKYSVLIL